MKKRVIALLICLVFVINTFVGCGKSGGSKESSTKDQGGSNTASTTETAAGGDNWSWPLNEKKELNFWIVWNNNYVESPNDLPAIQQIEKNTNVHINWTIVSDKEAAEKFSVMIASGEYPDIIRGAEGYYTGGLVKMMNDGVSIDLTDKVDQYMPNYTALRNSVESLKKDTVTDDGKLVALYTLASENGNLKGERVWGGPSIRKDWLDEAGLSVPVTVDDWYTALTAIKKNHPDCEAPLMIGPNGTDYYGTFLSAFGVLPEFYNDNGTVKYGPKEAGYKQWVETFRKWYAEGLIDPNFVSNAATVISPADFLGTGKAAAGPNVWGYTADVYKSMGYNKDEKFKLAGVSYPVLKAGDTPQAAAPMSELVKETLVVSSSCKDVELAMRYLDYWYTKDCMMLGTLGIKDESYVENSDGTYSMSDSIKAKITDGTYPTVAEALSTVTLMSSDFGLYNWKMWDSIYEGNPALNAYDAWIDTKYDLMLPPCMTMTDEESQEYASVYTNILTLVQENTVKFINGTKSMDEYDSFIEDLSKYGIDRCIELKQAALDRYLQRGK